MRTMRSVIKAAPGEGHLEMAVRPVPEIGLADILVKVEAAAVCGTDVHIREWNDWAAKRLVPPRIIGHEFAGKVVETGPMVKSVKVGDIVSAETHVVCNSCSLCRTGNAHVCKNTTVIGVSREGCFAEYIAIPAENAFKCDPSLPIEVLSLMEPFGVAVHAAMEFPVTAKSVAVVGCGPIGVMAVAVAKKAGARSVIAVEPVRSRADLARRMGADLVVDPLASDPVKAIKDLTGGLGVDIVLEFSGNIPAIKAAIEYTRPEGAIVAVGLPSQPITFDFSEFVYRGIALKGIAGRLMYKTWEQIGPLLASGIDLRPVVTHTLPLGEYERALDMMRSGECSKAVLIP